MNEIWVDIDYKDVRKNRYMVSDMGRVKNKLTNRILKTATHYKTEYVHITLDTTIKGKRKTYLLHRIVLYHFNHHPNFNKLEVNHKKRDKNNNSIHELEWATSQENKNHYYTNGSNELLSGCVYSDELIHNICELLEKENSIDEIISILNLPNNTQLRYYIYDLIIGKHHKHITQQYTLKKGKTVPYSKRIKYSKSFIPNLCGLISQGFSFKQIKNKIVNECRNEKMLKDLIRDIKNGKKYKNLFNKIKERSTTMEIRKVKIRKVQ